MQTLPDDSYDCLPPPPGVGLKEGQIMAAESSDRAEPRRHHGHEEAHAAANREIVRRLKSAEGHIRGITRMVEDEAYCIDVLKQLKAVRAALDRAGELALETHLGTCVTDGLRSDDELERARVIREIVDVFQANAKR